MSDTEDLNVGDFDPSTYQHVLPEGAHDFDDYDSEYEREHPELGFTDEQVEAEVAKLDPEDKKVLLKNTVDSWMLTTASMARLLKCPDLIKLIMTGRYPEIPSTTRKEQEELREKLMVETRKRGDVPAGRIRRGATQKGQEDSSRKNWENYRCQGR